MWVFFIAEVGEGQNQKSELSKARCTNYFFVSDFLHRHNRRGKMSNHIHYSWSHSFFGQILLRMDLPLRIVHGLDHFVAQVTKNSVLGTS
jgi:hypothetical protein